MFQRQVSTSGRIKVTLRRSTIIGSGRGISSPVSLGSGSCLVINTRFDPVLAAWFSFAQMHGEFHFWQHGFQDAGMGNFLARCVGDGHFDIGPLLEWTQLKVDFYPFHSGEG